MSKAGKLGSDRGITVTAQNINEVSTTQMHKLGERLVRDERVFRYAKCETEALKPGRMAATKMTPKEDYACGATTVHDVGANTVTIDTVATLTANQLAGGYLCYNATEFYCHKILSHPAATATYTCVITLETALTDFTLTSGDNVTTFPSIWKVRGHVAPAGAYWAYVGMPMCSVAANEYCWIQTWGPTLVCPGEFLGATQAQRALVIGGDGASGTRVGADPYVGYQDMGFLLPDTYTVGTAGADLADTSMLVCLTIFP